MDSDYHKDDLKLQVQYLMREMKELKEEVNILQGQIEVSIQGKNPNETPLHDNFSIASFTAYATESRDYVGGEVVLFDQTIINYGDFYNSVASIFRCDVNGFYLFAVHMAESSVDAEIYINYENPLLARQTGIHSGGQGSTSIFTICPAGSLVWVQTTNDGGHVYGDVTNRWSTFSGTFLFASTL